MSKSKHYLYSTLGADVEYPVYIKGPEKGSLPTARQSVTIKGGAGVANRHEQTPQGVMTEVTDEALEALRGNDVFNLHVQNGYVLISDSKVDPEVAAADMTLANATEGGAQLTEADFVDGGRPKVAGEPEREDDASDLPAPHTGGGPRGSRRA